MRPLIAVGRALGLRSAAPPRKGKGEKLANNVKAATRDAASALLSLPIQFYRLFLSPFLGCNCRFEPSCSAYALEALRVHGPLKGSRLTVRRLLSCHPIAWLGGRSGHDPVPPR